MSLLALAAFWLPIGLSDASPPLDFEPALWVPWFLISSIGMLFFIVSAQAPLMQRWYALETSRGDPYPLYAASHLGSFAGLISYPLLVQPLARLAAPRRAPVVAGSHPPAIHPRSTPPPPWAALPA